MMLYHILNRGVEKRNIFIDVGDRVRFVHNLYEFNRGAPANNTSWQLAKAPPENTGHTIDASRLVDIHAWVLMKNHYHLLLSERAENGITKFIRKINIGYAKFFNEKYKRSGTLFQGRTKRVPIATDAHFLHILHYIHLNPLDFLASARDWRQREITQSTAALEYLDAYRWSSYQDYCGKKNFPSLISTDVFDDYFGTYKNTIRAYLTDIDTGSLGDLLLE